MAIIKISKTVTTDSSGDASVTLGALQGKLVSIEYVKTDYATGVDFTITAGNQTLWTEVNVNASQTVYPVAAAALGTGTASTITEVQFPLVIEDAVSIVVAQGGATKVGVFHIIVDATIAK